MLAEVGRAGYVAVDGLDAVAAFRLCTTLEGIMPALETAHVLHHVGRLAAEVGPGGRILLRLSGQGDKDMHIVEPVERRGDCTPDVAAVLGAIGGAVTTTTAVLAPQPATALTATPARTLAARLRSDDGGLALVPYLMAGHPRPRTTCEVGRLLANSGVAAIELGIPYRDPLADGPVIQRAAQRVLDAGASVAGSLQPTSPPSKVPPWC